MDPEEVVITGFHTDCDSQPGCDGPCAPEDSQHSSLQVQLDAGFLDTRPGPPGAVKRPSRFPM